ncbi:hypothetical protein KBI23_20820 [bacterium]|nr:hypothetical protein [bacterium]
MSRFYAALPSSNKMKKLCHSNEDLQTSLQTLCLFIAVGIVSFILFCISDVVTEVVSYITTGFFNDTFASDDWLQSTVFAALVSTSAILSLTILGKVYLRSKFGPPAYVHSFVIDLPQIFAIRLCQNYMTELVSDDSWLLDIDGKRIIGLMRETCRSSTYVELTTMAIEQERTLIVVRAATVPTGRAALLSGFFCDFGKCREAAGSVMEIFSSYISHCRLQDINSMFARKADEVSIGWCPPPMYLKTNQFQEELSCKM